MAKSLIPSINSNCYSDNSVMIQFVSVVELGLAKSPPGPPIPTPRALVGSAGRAGPG